MLRHPLSLLTNGVSTPSFGTGIGKSYFAAYLLAAVVRQFTRRPEAGGVLVHDHAPPLVYVNDEGTARRLLWDGRVARVDVQHIERLPSNAFIIFDGACSVTHWRVALGVRAVVRARPACQRGS